jgi:hypothetical protein
MNVKKSSLLVLLLFLTSSKTHAQGDKNAFYKAVDYCNCKLANSYCQTYAASHKGSKEETSFKIIQGKLSCKIEAPLSYDSLTDLLKRNNFKSYTEKSAPEFKKLRGLSPESFTKQQAIKEITDGIFSNQNLSSVISQAGFLNQEQAITKELDKYFEGKFSNEATAETVTIPVQSKTPKVTFEDLQTQVESLRQQAEDNTQHWYSPNWISIIICIVLVAVFFFLIGGRITELKERIDGYRSEEKSYGSKQNTNWNQTPTSNNNARELAEYKKSIEQQLEGVIKVVENLRTEMTYQNQKSRGQETISYTPQQQIEKQQKVEVFFASIPNRDGSFNINAVTNSINPTASFYKFTITDSHSQKAAFEFLNEERAIKDATNAPERILRPVCKINNALNQNARRIRTVTPGTVIRQNDKWVLDFPAEIEYE